MRWSNQGRKKGASHWNTSQFTLYLFVLVYRSNLTKLTLQSDAAIKKLEKDREEGEKILRLTEVCRKLETEEEKVSFHEQHAKCIEFLLMQVLPFYASTLSAEEQDQVSSLEAEQPSEALAKVSLALFHLLLKLLHAASCCTGNAGIFVTGQFLETLQQGQFSQPMIKAIIDKSNQ